jgi:hypothetical protein
VIVADGSLSFRVGNTDIRLYAPPGGAGENERGLAVLCSEGTFDALITGDLGAAAEARLLSFDALPDIELLVAGHHGSKNSTSDALLEALRPETAVISLGTIPTGTLGGNTSTAYVPRHYRLAHRQERQRDGQRCGGQRFIGGTLWYSIQGQYGI